MFLTCFVEHFRADELKKVLQLHTSFDKTIVAFIPILNDLVCYL